MKYLLEAQILSYLNTGKPVHQLLGFFQTGEFRCLRWIEIYRDKNSYELFLHNQYDDVDEGIGSIEHFSYVEPDDLCGKIVFAGSSLPDVMGAATQLGASNDRYLTFGFMDQGLAELRTSAE